MMLSMFVIRIFLSLMYSGHCKMKWVSLSICFSSQKRQMRSFISSPIYFRLPVQIRKSLSPIRSLVISDFCCDVRQYELKYGSKVDFSFSLVYVAREDIDLI
eukprot:Lithocolla_globosa_v1_NODE_562_length_3717_cov_114.139989.p4 type:complete len:102 gc:universal NODE_562_length_3717_cov_114.139989:1362-1057(-)